MDNKKSFLRFGIAILVIVSAFSRKNTKKENIIDVYFSSSSGNCRWLGTNYSPMFTTGGFGAQAGFKTQGGINVKKLWGTGECAAGADPIHFHG